MLYLTLVCLSSAKSSFVANIDVCVWRDVGTLYHRRDSDWCVVCSDGTHSVSCQAWHWYIILGEGWCFMSSSVTMDDASSQSHTHLDRIRLRGLSHCVLGGIFLWLDQQMGHWYLILLILYFIRCKTDSFFVPLGHWMFLLSGTLMLNLVMWDITFPSCWSRYTAFVSRVSLSLYVIRWYIDAFSRFVGHDALSCLVGHWFVSCWVGDLSHYSDELDIDALLV